MFLTLPQIAESLGVSEGVIEDWIRHERMPHMRDGNRVLFDRAEVLQWAAARGLAPRAGFLVTENGPLVSRWSLSELLRAGGVWRGVKPGDVLDVLARVLDRLPGVTAPVRRLLESRLRAAGGITWAPVGSGMALPHLSQRVVLGAGSGLVALLHLEEGFEAAGPTPDGVAVQRMLFFVAPTPRAHLDLLARLSRAVASGPFRQALLAGAGDEALLAAAAEVDGGGPEVGAGT
ncbi:MAG: excisionase family DNA-binding protein [Limisphaera sp.]